MLLKAVKLDESDATRGADFLDKQANRIADSAQHARSALPNEARVQTRCIAEVKSEPLSWLWLGRFPLGKLSILSGDPGQGKSLVTLAIAAAVSRGAPWPCSEGKAPQGDVLLISAEDDAADTIRPRLEAAEADLSRIHILEWFEQVSENGELVRRPWSFTDVDALDARLALLPGCKIVIVDPLSAYLAGTDSHKNADVRSLLAPLSDMAARRKVAVLCVSHLNKSAGPAMYRTTGSLAFVAAARAAYAVARDQDNPARRLVLPIKCNLSPDSTGLAYRIGVAQNGSPVIEWESQPVTASADDVLAMMREDPSERGEREEAIAWLEQFLADGPRSANEVKAEARAAGLSWSTVRRAQDVLGIRPSKTQFRGSWEWALPTKVLTEAEDAQPQDMGNFGNIEHLGASEVPTETQAHIGSSDSCFDAKGDIANG